ncbi:MAG TPA: Uma2 family endonuclease [Nostocaceae cyanobacterium]|nr:Uma2 family endonuclease [Nostocaceae cyanobacterium]
MSQLKTIIPPDTWITASWDEYIQIIENPQKDKAKGYYYKGRMRIEMTPIGNDHASDHTIVILAASIYASIKSLPMNGKDNCTFRKTGIYEIQPDVSYYIGENADIIPWGTGIINLDQYPAPNLVIEVANSSLADDKGEKRLIYEEIGVNEYWIIDVKNVQIIAFMMENGGSKRIFTSQVLPGLEISLLEAALRKTRTMNQSLVIAWLLSEFQK